MVEKRDRSTKLPVLCLLAMTWLYPHPAARAQQAPIAPAKATAQNPALFNESEKAFASQLGGMKVADALKEIADAEQERITSGLYHALRAMGNDVFNHDPYRSTEIFEMAEAVAVRAGMPIQAADARSMEGAGMVPNGPLDGAMTAFDQSIEMYRAAGAPQEKIASVHISRAYVRESLGDATGAIKDANDAMRMMKNANDEVGVARANNTLGGFYRDQGDYGMAETTFQEALRLARAHNETLGEAFVLNNLSMVYTLEGDLPRSAQMCEESLKIKRKVGNKFAIATSLINLSNIYHQQGRNADANKVLVEAAQLGRETNRTVVTAKAIAQMGIIELHSHHPQEALKLLEEGDKLAVSAQDLSSHLINLTHTADAYFELADYNASLKTSMEVEGLAQKFGDTAELASGALFAGRAAMMMGNVDEARTHFKTSIAAVERMRDNIAGGAQTRQQFLSERTDPYRYLSQADAMQGDWIGALDRSERGKGRTLLDVFAGNPAKATASLAEAERQEQARLQARYLSLSMQSSPGVADGLSGPSRSSLNDKLKQAKVDLDTFREEIYGRHPGLKLRSADIDPVSLEDMQRLVPQTATALLEYEVTPNHIYLFVVTRGPEQKAAITGYALPVSLTELQRHIHRYDAQLASRDPELAVESRWLYDALLKPARTLLQGKTSLVIVPDDTIWHVPFQSLQRADGRYIAEQASISYVPSLAVLHALRASPGGRHTGRRLFVMGDPGEETPEQKHEADALANLYGAAHSRKLLGKEATLIQFRSTSPSYEVVHIAAHGIFNDHDPMSSHMILASARGGPAAGWLQAREIQDMKFKADVVVLSGCETGKGAVEDGEGSVGMSWAVLAAGAHGVVASAWRVEASSTTQMMLAFHDGLLHGTAKGEALRRAQMKLIHTPKYGHPYYWAAFRLTGDGV